jgi:hypothetical protein
MVNNSTKINKTNNWFKVASQRRAAETNDIKILIKNSLTFSKVAKIYWQNKKYEVILI